MLPTLLYCCNTQQICSLIITTVAVFILFFFFICLNLYFCSKLTKLVPRSVSRYLRVKHFLGFTLVFRSYLNICYRIRSRLWLGCYKVFLVFKPFLKPFCLFIVPPELNFFAILYLKFPFTSVSIKAFLINKQTFGKDILR